MASIPHVVDTEWLAQRLDDPRLRLLDATTFLKIREGGAELVSGRSVYEKEHIPGAVFADLITELSDPDSPFHCTVPSHERFAEAMGALGVGDGTYVVVYDQGAPSGSPEASSMWASRLWWQLRLEGFDDVAVLAGGLSKWKEEGRPVTSEPSSYPSARFTGKRRPGLLATKEEVKEALGDPSVVLIDSLSPEDHLGKRHVYPRNGHIPGSVNVFFGNLTDPRTQHFLAPEMLKEIFGPTGALDPSRKVITYCGGGIAATWVALALAQLGRDDVAVYDGSRIEWASDPSLPLVSG
ncbi:MAG: thiosulfate sulfurtransferase [Bacillus thermozeamaize]|uniref:Thiosulfate sulfurtransferase n=1 Tax=Bacillus thermozeamaize TaxID=230954 RepID=A0A1Y3PB31_9BACI|nr:MAG: thiosulfate sulfurtransferase [Bacillus thermozeamaize]